jgi:hypothetical protein
MAVIWNMKWTAAGSVHPLYGRQDANAQRDHTAQTNRHLQPELVDRRLQFVPRNKEVGL